jgi:hypothetical protein
MVPGSRGRDNLLAGLFTRKFRASVRQRTDANPKCVPNAVVQTENHMYIGGILGTILIIAVIFWLVRRT